MASPRTTSPSMASTKTRLSLIRSSPRPTSSGRPSSEERPSLLLLSRTFLLMAQRLSFLPPRLRPSLMLPPPLELLLPSLT
ncbi:unnamed protein product [Oikopleura dioica]|uniref:Uncharacterized protein n=1 Tax=Oikopleura dioica TaxID=34765 RepID=E4Z7D9_OIKDI|nr:unnamed protein product [Oikopleura dioica]